MLTPLLVAVLMVSGACAAQPVTREVGTDTRPRPRGAALLRGAMLQSHNDARRSVGAPPLAWSAALARDAAGYAAKLAREKRFEHSPLPRGTPVQGENLWMGTRSAYGYAEMAGGWVEERRYFKAGRFPAVSRTGKWSDVGHYTQIIWRTTTEVGCGVAANKTDEYLVCRYVAAGNVMGADPLTGKP